MKINFTTTKEFKWYKSELKTDINFISKNLKNADVNWVMTLREVEEGKDYRVFILFEMPQYELPISVDFTSTSLKEASKIAEGIFEKEIKKRLGKRFLNT